MDQNVPCPDEIFLEYAKKLKAAGHPIRLRLLCLIAREQDPCVSDLWKCLKQPQPVISQHLAILKQNGIVEAEVQKTRRVYSIADPFIRDLIATILAESSAVGVKGTAKVAPKIR
ncbi:MAG: transcriptional regulator [Spirochaetales bacterium]|nr:MAG: transcriptional regulator [Spirochaetales bacterium]